MTELFDLTEKEYRLERKVAKLRAKIKARTAELNIQPKHDDSGHWYEFQGKKYGSVTKSLHLLKDPSIENWKMNRALNHMGEWYADRFTSTNTGLMPSLSEFKEAMQAAALAPVQEFEGAGGIGRQVHEWREEWFRLEIEGKGIFKSIVPREADPAVISGCRAIQTFITDTHYIPLACELYVADEKLEIGGTADDIGLLPVQKPILVWDGKNWVDQGDRRTEYQLCFLDLKTSNIGDKDAYFYQVALYVYMFEKLYGMRTQAWKILHVSKTDGTYKLIDIPDIRRRIREAKQIIKVDRFLEALKEEKKKVAIVI